MKLTNTQRKLILSLASARQRRSRGLFVAEGIRSLRELLPSFQLQWLVTTPLWFEEHASLPGEMCIPADRLLTASADDMRRISSMQTPQGVMGVFSMPVDEPFDVSALRRDPARLVLALDTIQDPGNLGTIIRVADWFGIDTVLASHETADQFSPKVVQSTMGALARVRVHYCDLCGTLGALASAGVPVYGTMLDGGDLYSTPLTAGGVIVMGNEGNGISDAVAATLTCRIRIPSFPPGATTVESLNVGTATAITVAEFRRRIIH